MSCLQKRPKKCWTVMDPTAPILTDWKELTATATRQNPGISSAYSVENEPINKPYNHLFKNDNQKGKMQHMKIWTLMTAVLGGCVILAAKRWGNFKNDQTSLDEKPEKDIQAEEGLKKNVPETENVTDEILQIRIEMEKDAEREILKIVMEIPREISKNDQLMTEIEKSNQEDIKQLIENIQWIQKMAQRNRILTEGGLKKNVPETENVTDEILQIRIEIEKDAEGEILKIVMEIPREISKNDQLMTEIEKSNQEHIQQLIEKMEWIQKMAERYKILTEEGLKKNVPETENVTDEILQIRIEMEKDAEREILKIVMEIPREISKNDQLMTQKEKSNLEDIKQSIEDTEWIKLRAQRYKILESQISRAEQASSVHCSELHQDIPSLAEDVKQEGCYKPKGPRLHDQKLQDVRRKNHGKLEKDIQAEEGLKKNVPETENVTDEIPQNLTKKKKETGGKTLKIIMKTLDEISKNDQLMTQKEKSNLEDIKQLIENIQWIQKMMARKQILAEEGLKKNVPETENVTDLILQILTEMEKDAEGEILKIIVEIPGAISKNDQLMTAIEKSNLEDIKELIEKIEWIQKMAQRYKILVFQLHHILFSPH